MSGIVFRPRKLSESLGSSAFRDPTETKCRALSVWMRGSYWGKQNLAPVGIFKSLFPPQQPVPSPVLCVHTLTCIPGTLKHIEHLEALFSNVSSLPFLS